MSNYQKLDCSDGHNSVCTENLFPPILQESFAQPFVFIKPKAHFWEDIFRWSSKSVKKLPKNRKVDFSEGPLDFSFAQTIVGL